MKSKTCQRIGKIIYEQGHTDGYEEGYNDGCEATDIGYKTNNPNWVNSPWPVRNSDDIEEIVESVIKRLKNDFSKRRN